MLKRNLLADNRICREKCLGAGFFILCYHVRTRHLMSAHWSKQEKQKEESFYKCLLFHLGNAGLQEAVKTTGTKGFLVWINFPESDLLEVCKVRMAFKCILTGHRRQKRMKFFFSALLLQETSRWMRFFPQTLSKNHWECLSKKPLMVYNRMLYSFRPVSPTLVAASMHAITWCKHFALSGILWRGGGIMS